MSDLGDDLRSNFSDAPTFEFTEGGIWVTTPTGVIRNVVELVAAVAEVAAGELGRPLRIFDAGAGDGRWIYALSRLEGAGERWEALGVELDPSLAARAAKAVADSPFSVIQGDYFALTHPFAMTEADIVLNYPDGSEQAIADHLAGSNAELWLVSAELNPRIGGLALVRSLKIDTAPFPWTLAVFAGRASWLERVPGLSAGKMR